MQPGQWEGIHTHSGNQLYIMLTDGQWTVRHGDQETTSVSSAGLVDWQRAVDLSVEHYNHRRLHEALDTVTQADVSA